MRIAIDTNRYVDFCRGDEAIVQLLQSAEEIHLPFITLGELRAGFRAGTRASSNERVLTQFLNSPRVDTLFADAQTTHHYAQLFSQLRAQGTPIPTNDLWIAALVVQHNLTLVSRDQHFAHLPQLARV